jgi:hypothetical protein
MVSSKEAIAPTSLKICLRTALVESLQQTNQVLEQLNDTAQVLQGIISIQVAS